MVKVVRFSTENVCTEVETITFLFSRSLAVIKSLTGLIIIWF